MCFKHFPDDDRRIEKMTKNNFWYTPLLLQVQSMRLKDLIILKVVIRVRFSPDVLVPGFWSVNF